MHDTAEPVTVRHGRSGHQKKARRSRDALLAADVETRFRYAGSLAGEWFSLGDVFVLPDGLDVFPNPDYVVTGLEFRRRSA